MVNSGITKVGVITKSNYQSLMDHLSNGEDWDLSRKHGGIYILPPFGAGQQQVYKGKIEALWGAISFLEHSTEEYVVVSDTYVVANINYRDALNFHKENHADITMIVCNEELADRQESRDMVVKVDEDNRVNDVMLSYNAAGKAKVGIGTYLLRREKLLNLIYEAMSYNRVNFERDIIQRKYNELRIYAYEFSGTVLNVDNVANYYKANMQMLDKKAREDIFLADRPIFTKVKDEVPTLYEDHCVVKNCFIADGCVVDGYVENSVLFRGVRVKKGAVVKNCILMQDTDVGEDAQLNCVITDKEVKITQAKNLNGAPEYPVIINKGTIV
jgi:glucose-1-phosphate adenylyltransferase